MSTFKDGVICTLFGNETKSCQYTYTRDNKDFVISSGMLKYLFKTHGFLVDPGSRTFNPLLPVSIEKLKILSEKYGDKDLSDTINNLSGKLCGDTFLSAVTNKEKLKLDKFSTTEKFILLSTLKNILNVGMQLLGWKGEQETYICSPKHIDDTFRVELKVIPLIESVMKMPNYKAIKSFPVIYYENQSFVINNKLKLDDCLRSVLSGLADCDRIYETAVQIVSTSYYYITHIFGSSLPMVEPLMRNLFV